MHTTHRRVIGVIASLSCAAMLWAVPMSGQAAALTDTQRAQRAVAYLAQKQRPNGSIVAFSAIGSTADAVMAFVAAGAGSTHVTKALNYLSGRVAAGKVTTLGLQAKVVMAVTAAGGNPRTFGGTDLLSAIRNTLGSDGHYGDTAVFDDALALLAVESAGVTPAKRAANWLLAAQCPDGGWAYDKPYDPGTDDTHCADGSGTDFFPSDSNTTSYVVQGLGGAGFHRLERRPVRVLRHGARSGQRRLELLRLLPRHGRELHRARPAGVRGRGPDAAGRRRRVAATAPVPRVRRVRLQLERRRQGRSGRRGDHRRRAGAVAEGVPGPRIDGSSAARHRTLRVSR